MTVAIFALTAAWHAVAFWHFTFTPARTLARTTHERPIPVVPTELFRFLGGLNASLMVLAVLACALPGARLAAAITLAIANLSQAVQDVRVMRLGIARGSMFRQILVGDCVVTVANVLIAAAAISR